MRGESIPETPSEIRRVLAGRGLVPHRSRGQHFLSDRGVRDAIVDVSGVRPGDLVLEVGPGLGCLTKGLLEAGARVVAVEIDRGLCGFLREAFAGEDRLLLVEGDVLERGALSPRVLDALGSSSGGREEYRVVSNLPYSAATPFVAAAVGGDPPPASLAVMVQGEVARRMAARPGTREYGPLSVLLALRGRVRVVKEVKGTVFTPRARVSSAVVEILPRGGGEKAEAADRLARALFRYRRKSLRRALAAAGYPREPSEAALRALGAPEGVRPENLSPEQFVELAGFLGRSPS